MEEFTTVHGIIVVTTTAVAIAVFLSLAIYITSQNLYRPTAWLFSLTCLIVAGTYFISFFMVSGSESALLCLLRLRWTAIIFGSTLFLHLTFFYFPPAWQRYRLWILLPAYLVSFGLAGATLFTDWVIAAPLPQAAPHIALPLPGPLMPYQAGLFILEILGVAFGLGQNWRRTRSASLRRQLGLLLLPTALIFIAGVLHSFRIFGDVILPVPHELPDAFLLIAAVLYIRAAVHYGSFIGRPLAWRRLFYAGLLAVGGLAALYLTLWLDSWLMLYTHFPYPPATAMLVLIIAAGFPAAGRWLTRRLDGWLFSQERRQLALTRRLAAALMTRPDADSLPRDLLETLCLVLDAPGGFFAAVESSAETFTVREVRGVLPLSCGDSIPYPQSISALTEVQLLPPTGCVQPPESIWTEMALLCPLQTSPCKGLLALSEKRDSLPFTAQDISLCTELMQRLETLSRQTDLYRQSNPPGSPSLSLQPPPSAGKTGVVSSTSLSPLSPAGVVKPIEIRLLGPLQIMRDGQLAPESAWGSEKAKLMLAYLLWKGPAGASREELSGLLWPDRSLEEAANIFHVTLHRLRRVFQPEPAGKDKINYILYDRSRYRFNPAAPHWLDVTQFEALSRSPALADQQAAIALYRGTYLEDTAWALPIDIEIERRRLEQLYAAGLRRLVAQSDDRQATLYLEKLLTVEPADETARRTLVLNYLAQGRNDLARRHIDIWQRILAELGLEPLPETAAFWKAVQAKAVYGLNSFRN